MKLIQKLFNEKTRSNQSTIIEMLTNVECSCPFVLAYHEQLFNILLQ